MLLESITLESAIKAAAPVAKKIFSTKISPYLAGRLKIYYKSKSSVSEFEKRATKYLAQAFGKCSTLNTIAFQNTPKRIDDLYIPLTITYGSEKNKTKVDDGADIFANHSHIILVDSAGMGKSTLAKKVVINTIQQQSHVPVFFELRELDERPISEQIAGKLGITNEHPEKILGKLPLLYVLDGMDEVPIDLQKQAVSSINAFSNTFRDSHILLTSRKESYISQFVGFCHYSIESLREEEAFSLIKKYDPSGNISDKLIAGINDGRESGLKEFLATPLYVSLLYCSYRFKTALPRKRHLFYSQVYDALFESHDLSKDVGYVRPKYSKLDSSEFHIVLRRLGFWCLKNNGQIEFQKDRLEIVVQAIADSISGVEVRASDYCKDIVSTVPIFVKEGATFRWAHKSLMEYFAAMFICSDAKSEQNKLLMHFYNSKQWTSYQNLLELCADIDYGSFRSSIIRDMLERYISYSQSSEYGKINNRRIKKREIDTRKALCFAADIRYRCADSYRDAGYSRIRGAGDELAEMMKFYDNSNRSASSLSMALTMSDSGAMLLAAVQVERERLAINVLWSKCPNLFIDEVCLRENIVDMISGSTLHNRKIRLVSDGEKCLENNSVNFKLINHMLFNFGLRALDPESAAMELEDILQNETNGILGLIEGL